MTGAVNLSFAAFPNKTPTQAVGLAKMVIGQAGSEPMFERLSFEHVQLVPQSAGRLTEAVCDELKIIAPDTEFRLHANVRVLAQYVDTNLSNMGDHQEWFMRAAQIHKYVGAGVYTAHSGLRKDASFEQLLDNARRCADLFECPVAIEGQYPSTKDDWMISTWDEYRALYESGIPYVLDLSHINILAVQSGVFEFSLLKDMLVCENMLELHVSENDGTGDWHQVCESKPWWFDFLDFVHADAVIFSEGNHLRKIKQL